MRERGPLRSINYHGDFWLDYLDRNVFQGLKCFYPGSGSPANKFFSEKDFGVIFERIDALGIGVLGMHTHLEGKFGMELFEWQSHEMTNKEWIPFAFNRLREGRKSLHYMAVLHIFDEQLLKN